jgi:hypothetical protein
LNQIKVEVFNVVKILSMPKYVGVASILFGSFKRKSGHLSSLSNDFIHVYIKNYSNLNLINSTGIIVDVQA